MSNVRDANGQNEIPLTKESKYRFVLPASPFLDMLSCLSSSRGGATNNPAPIAWCFFLNSQSFNKYFSIRSGPDAVLGRPSSEQDRQDPSSLVISF